MQLPGTPSLAFLVWLLLVLPWAAWRSARQLREAADAAPGRRLPKREAIWISTFLSQLVLFGLAWLTGGSFDFELFALPPQGLGLRDVVAAAGALAAAFVLRGVLRAVRTEDERRQALVYRIAPRGPREGGLWLAAVLAASVAEEAAYRGVGLQILWYSLGSQAAAILICASAFAVAHAMQGWKSGLMIFALALLMHGLVAFTGTLVLAMLIHAVFDIVAGWRIARDAAQLQPESGAAGG
jgi:membrane protease YdiL (CAAX protease family)